LELPLRDVGERDNRRDRDWSVVTGIESRGDTHLHIYSYDPGQGTAGMVGSWKPETGR
jgi:hypothetical protein